MNELALAWGLAWTLLLSGDPALMQIIGLSLYVSATALAIAGTAALPVAALLALHRFPGRSLVVALLNTAMGLPPVVVGLVVYLLLSRSGPLGAWGWLFTPTAMILAQTLLVFPVVAALSYQSLRDLLREYEEQLRVLHVSFADRVMTLLWEARGRLLTAWLAGLGRALAEVGAVLLVGGNIAGHTRLMTTAIALETSRGDLALALALGVNAAALALRHDTERHE